MNVLPNDYFFRVSSGDGAVWITTGSDGHVLRVDPASTTVTAGLLCDERASLWSGLGRG